MNAKTTTPLSIHEKSIPNLENSNLMVLAEKKITSFDPFRPSINFSTRLASVTRFSNMQSSRSEDLQEHEPGLLFVCWFFVLFLFFVF